MSPIHHTAGNILFMGQPLSIKEMTNCPLCGINLDIDNIALQLHLSDRHGNPVELAKALGNILERLEKLERNIEKSHGPTS